MSLKINVSLIDEFNNVISTEEIIVPRNGNSLTVVSRELSKLDKINMHTGTIWKKMEVTIEKV